MNNPKFLLSSMTLAVLTLMNQAYAQQASDTAAATTPAASAQQTPTQALSQDTAVKQEVQQVVVTGVAGGGAKRKLDTAFSITTATEEQIKEANPTSLADLIKIVPGIYVESTGGQSGANIQIRGMPSAGDAPYVTIAVDGSPIYPQSSLSFQANDALFRMDDTVERVEVLVGGPQTLFSNGQYGATMNFQLKTGTDTPEGSIRVTAGTGELQRYDLFYSGKISDGWYGTVGGYYETDYGVRDAGFPAVDGGQVSATLTRKLDDGKLTFYVRSTKEQDAFYTSVPLLQNPTTGALSAFPGFSPLTGTYENGEIRQAATPGGPTADLQNGRGLHGNVLGFNFDQKIDGWNVVDKANYTNESIPTIALFSGNTPQTMGAYINGAVASVNASPSIIAAAGGKLATGGAATYIDNGAAVDPNQQVIQNGFWIIQKQIESFSNEFQMSKEIVKDHSVTFGLYTASYSSNDNWDIGNLLLQSADNSGRPINVTLNNGAVMTNAGGYTGGAGFLLNESGNAEDRAVYIHDDWKVTDSLNLNAGVRTQHSTVDLTNVFGGSSVNSNPLNVYNSNVVQFSAPGAHTVSYHDQFTQNSFLLGGVYKLAKNTSVFLNDNYGGSTPNFDQLRGTNPAQAPNNQTVHQIELGFKTATPLYSAYVTLFENHFDNLFLSQISAGGVVQNTTGGATAHGLTYELAVRPLTNLQIALSGDLQKAHYEGYNDAINPGINGNEEQRQPNEQFRLTPSYIVPMGDNSLKFYGTWSYVGLRYSDQQQTQILPSYETLDAGAILSVGEKLEFRLTGTNLTNELGITEGNVHGVNGGTLGGQNLVIGRPLFGREIKVSAMYRF